MKNKILDKFNFIFFSFSFGVVLWMITVCFQVLHSPKAELKKFLIQLLIIVPPIYFISKVGLDSNKKPFERALFSLLSFTVAVILFFTINIK